MSLQTHLSGSGEQGCRCPDNLSIVSVSDDEEAADNPPIETLAGSGEQADEEGNRAEERPNQFLTSLHGHAVVKINNKSTRLQTSYRALTWAPP